VLSACLAGSSVSTRHWIPRRSRKSVSMFCESDLVEYKYTVSDVNLPVKYICSKKNGFFTDFLPVKFDTLNSYQ